jgi:4-amino-4-deoxy-L-arabinose transferase-like glycosyltransferase
MRGLWTTAWLVVVAATLGASLVLIDAPPGAAYQHYRLPPTGTAGWLALAVLIVNGLLVLTAGRDHVVTALQWARHAIRPAALVLLVLAVLATGAAPSAQPAAYLPELVFAALVALLAALALLAAVRTLPERALDSLARAADRLLGPGGAPGPVRPDRFALIVATSVTVAAAVLSATVYERHPHVPDEVVYLLQARYLADGMLTMPASPVPDAFNIDLMHYEPDRWFSPVPPGWPFVLAVGAWFGAPWLVNPVLGGLAIVLAYPLLGALFDRRTTRLALLLLATSPWFLFMSMNFMTHTLALVCALAGGLGVARARTHGRALPAFAAGLGTGAVSLIRPLEGVAVAVLVGLWSLGARGRRFRFSPSAWLVAGTVLSGALTFPYNRLLTGNPTRFPLMAYIDKYYAPGSNDMGFGPNRGLGWSGLDPFPGHGAADVAVNALLNASQVNVELLGWPTGAVLLIGCLLARGTRSLTRQDAWLLAAVAVVAGSHTFYWFSGGPDFGARYWYLIIVPCVALAARAVRGAFADQSPHTTLARRNDVGPTVAAFVLMVLAVTVYVPWRAAGKYHHYRGMRADVRDLARDERLAGSLVLVRGRRHPDFASAAIYNPIDLRSPAPVFAWDASEQIRQRVLEAYPSRPVWIVDGPSLTRQGYRLVAGPLTADAARASPIRPSPAGDERHVRDPVSPSPLGMPP